MPKTESRTSPSPLPPAVTRAAASRFRITDVLRRVAETAVELTGADGAYVEQVVDGGNVEVVAVVGQGTPSLGTRVAYPGSVTEEVVRGGEPVVLATLEGIGPGIAPYLRESCPGCAALLAPLVARDDLLGALVLLRPAPRAFGGEHLVTVRSLGELAAASLRLVAEISQEREERTALLDSTAEGIYGIDPQGRCTFMNRSGWRMLGYGPDEVRGANMHRLIHHTRADGSAYSESACPIYRAAREGQGVRVSDEVLWRKDGSSFPAEYASYPIREGERLIGAVVTFRDVSERKREKERDARRRERERFLAEASSALGSSLDYETTLEGIARLAVPRIASYCMVDLLEAEERLRRVAVAHVHGIEESLLETAGPHVPSPGSASPAMSVLETGEPEHVPEVSDAWLDRMAQSPEHRELLRRLGPRSVIIVPLAAPGRTVGLLWLARTDPDRPYDGDDVALAVELGRRAGIAVDNAVLYSTTEEARGEAERRAREEAALREAIAAISASASTEEVIRRVAASALRATNADGAFVERIDVDRAETVVVAADGETMPAVGTRAPYEGSFTEQVVQRREPVLVSRVSAAGRGLPADLLAARPDDSGLVLPLNNGGEPIGALFLLRRVEKPPFRGDEVSRALSFADLAALAFRRIKMLEESETRREELQKVMHSRARLMRGFSHDVKNPLGAADGFLQLLEEGIGGELAARQRQHVARARRSIHSSLDLIADLLDLARAETGQLEIRWAAVDVRDAARELGEEYRVQAERKGLSLVLELPETLPVVRSDPTRVRQVLGNLLSNAVKYTAEGSVRVRVEVRAGDTAGVNGEWIVTEVRDTGPGIPREQQRLLFQEFTRLEPGETGGAGVGLAISRRIAHALGGDIVAESEPGEGSVFSFWLPAMRPGS